MVHSWSGGYGGKRDDVLRHIEHEDKRLDKLTVDLLKPYFSKKEIRKIQSGKDFWLDHKEMLKRDIATHIMIDGEVKTAEEYIKNSKKKKK
jgi:ATP-dependent protease ClpP protease subunit